MEGALATGKRRTLALGCVAAALVLDILDLTIVNVAIPSLRVGFGVGEAAAQWLVAGYAGLFATLLVTGGRLGDIFGYRRMLVIGVGLFVLTSALCGAAADADMLVLARLAQGAAAALVVPQINALVQLLYPPEERVSALALFGILGGSAAVLGPILGGLLIGANLWGLGWRPIFLVNVPIGLLTVAGTLLFVPSARAADRPRLDWAGTGLVTLTLAATLVPLIEGRLWGWPWWSFALLVAAVPLGWATVRHAARRLRAGRAALLVLPLFREPSFAIGLALVAGFQSVIAAFLFTLTLLLQQGLGYSATTAGLAHVPFALGAALGIGLLARRLVPRFRALLITAGALAMAGGLGLLVAAETLLVHPGPLQLAPGLLLAGLGMGLVSGPLAPIALSEIAARHAGAASGMLKATQELGGAIGVAALGSLFFALAGDGGGAIRFAFAGTAGGLVLLLVAGAIGARALPRGLRVFASPTGKLTDADAASE